MKRLIRHPAVQQALAWLLGCYLEFALCTTRWTLDGPEHMAPHLAGTPVIAAFWHERLPLMPMLWLLAQRMQPARPMSMQVLVSQHRDGRFIGTVLHRFNLPVVLGSSSRGGAAGLRNLVGLLADGTHVGITPDGPRGPRRRAAPGVAQLAALSGMPVMPCAAQTSRRWTLDSWDRMVIPRPFGRGVIVCGPTIAVPEAGVAAAVPVIAAALTAATDRADLLCSG